MKRNKNTLGMRALRPSFLFLLCLSVTAGYSQPLDGSPPPFKKHTISNDFISEGVGRGRRQQ